nr:hypothetical protein [Desulfosporosinus meridiei]
MSVLEVKNISKEYTCRNPFWHKKDHPGPYKRLYVYKTRILSGFSGRKRLR